MRYRFMFDGSEYKLKAGDLVCCTSSGITFHTAEKEPLSIYHGDKLHGRSIRMFLHVQSRGQQLVLIQLLLGFPLKDIGYDWFELQAE